MIVVDSMRFPYRTRARPWTKHAPNTADPGRTTSSIRTSGSSPTGAAMLSPRPARCLDTRYGYTAGGGRTGYGYSELRPWQRPGIEQVTA